MAFESYKNLSNKKIQIVRHMSKLQEKIELYTASAEKLGIAIEADLFKLVTKGIGPSIYKDDAELVSSSNKDELETIKKNFLTKKLGLEKDDEKLDAMIQKVVDTLGSGNKKKYRALFYYLLVKESGSESVYETVKEEKAEAAPEKAVKEVKEKKKISKVSKESKKEEVLEEKVADQPVAEVAENKEASEALAKKRADEYAAFIKEAEEAGKKMAEDLLAEKERENAKSADNISIPSDVPSHVNISSVVKVKRF